MCVKMSGIYDQCFRVMRMDIHTCIHNAEIHTYIHTYETDCITLASPSEARVTNKIKADDTRRTQLSPLHRSLYFARLAKEVASNKIFVGCVVWIDDNRLVQTMSELSSIYQLVKRRKNDVILFGLDSRQGVLYLLELATHFSKGDVKPRFILPLRLKIWQNVFVKQN